MGDAPNNFKRPDFHHHRESCEFKFAPLDVCSCIEENMKEHMANLEAAISRARAEGRAEALREAADLCRRTTMEIPMRRESRKYGGLYCAGEAMPGGYHEGMGYADLIAALQETPDDDDDDDDDEDDDTCTGCGDTGFNPFVEKFCSCAEGVALALAAGRKETPDAE